MRQLTPSLISSNDLVICARVVGMQRAEFNYTHKKQSGGAGQYARVVGYIEPIEEVKSEFVNQIVGNAIPPNFIPACEKVRPSPAGTWERAVTLTAVQRFSVWWRHGVLSGLHGGDHQGPADTELSDGHAYGAHRRPGPLGRLERVVFPPGHHGGLPDRYGLARCLVRWMSGQDYNKVGHAASCHGTVIQRLRRPNPFCWSPLWTSRL